MLFAFVMMDKPGATQLRQQMRPLHKSYFAEVQEQIAFAGPLVSDDGNVMLGSLLVIDFPNRKVAEDWLAKEPFVQAGVFASTTAVHAFQNLWPQRTGFPA